MPDPTPRIHTVGKPLLFPRHGLLSLTAHVTKHIEGVFMLHRGRLALCGKFRDINNYHIISWTPSQDRYRMCHVVGKSLYMHK